jgi:hypothetical protein
MGAHFLSRRKTILQNSESNILIEKVLVCMFLQSFNHNAKFGQDMTPAAVLENSDKQLMDGLWQASPSLCKYGLLRRWIAGNATFVALLPRGGASTLQKTSAQHPLRQLRKLKK